MNNKKYPEIFTFIECPILGAPGDDSIIEYGEACDACGREEEKIFEYLDYCIDGWDGQDIINVHGQYAVTEFLAGELNKSGLAGFRFQEMNVSKSEIFKSTYGKNDIAIPKFLHMVITGSAKSGPHGWWDNDGVCPKCGRVIWKHTYRVIEALTSKYSDEVGPPRHVINDTWEGDDIFNINDHGPPLVTISFVDLIKKLNVKYVIFHPAEWV